jgi:hypothetical protein
MSNLKIWSRVPPGSTLELSAQSATAAFDVRARFLDTNGTEELWGRPDLVPGPKRKVLDFPSVVRVAISFLSATEQDVELNARIVKPDGTIHGTPYRETFTGNNGAVERATIVIALREG